jgi:hypothetical protein
VEIVEPDGKPPKPPRTPEELSKLEQLAENRYVRGVMGSTPVGFLRNQAWAMGDINPFPEFPSTKGTGWKNRFKSGAGPGLLRILAPFLVGEGIIAASGASSAAGGEWGSTEEEKIDYIARTIREETGYPEDIAREMAATLNGNILSRFASAGGAVADQAIMDAITIALFTIGGAVIGGIRGIPGAVPGVIASGLAGAGQGYVWGRNVAGISNAINLIEIGTLPMGVDLPSIDDFSPYTELWKSRRFFDTNNNGIQDEGEAINPDFNPNMESGKWGLSQGFGEVVSGSQKEGWETVMQKYPDRFVPIAEAVLEQDRYARGYYDQPGMADPRIGETVTLISQGYFVYKNSQGNWAIDKDAIDFYLQSTTRYKNMDDKMGVLKWLYNDKVEPNLEFTKTLTNGITQDIYNGLWYGDID